MSATWEDLSEHVGKCELPMLEHLVFAFRCLCLFVRHGENELFFSEGV